MLYIENDVINMTRGDDASISITLTEDDGTEYELSSTEYLIFAVREVPDSDSELLLEIQSEPGENSIQFSHDDTADMDIGFYSAEAQLITQDGKRITVWPTLTGSKRTSTANRKNFCLMSEVVLN